MKSALLISLLVFSNFANARLPDELQPRNSSAMASAPRSTGAVTDPSFLININTVKCMARAEEIMRLLEYSFLLGPDGRTAVARGIQQIGANSQMLGLDEETVKAYRVASMSLSEQGRSSLKQSTTIECANLESEQQLQKVINDSALKVLMSFVENPLKGR